MTLLPIQPVLSLFSQTGLLNTVEMAVNDFKKEIKEKRDLNGTFSLFDTGSLEFVMRPVERNN